MRVSRGIRNVSLVLLLFVLVAALVVWSRFRPPSHVLPPESPEVARLRQSRTENGFFAIRDALALIPERPSPDDTGAQADWARACKPATDRARDALKIGRILMPLQVPVTEPPWILARTYSDLVRVPSVMMEVAVFEWQAGAPRETLLSGFKDSIRLALMLKNSVPFLWFGGPQGVCGLVRRFDPATQRDALAWLTEFNKSKPPPRQAAEDLVRMHEAWKGGWKYEAQHGPIAHRPLVAAEILRSASGRRAFAANVETVLDSFCLTRYKHDQWRQRHSELARSITSCFPGFNPYSFRYENTQFQNTLDAIELVLAVECYRNTHGSYPDTLAPLCPEFIPAIPVNNDSGKPFFYRPMGSGYCFAFSPENNDPGSPKWNEIIIKPPEE